MTETDFAWDTIARIKTELRKLDKKIATAVDRYGVAGASGSVSDAQYRSLLRIEKLVHTAEGKRKQPV